MNPLLMVASVVLPLVPVILFPTRFIGRGMVQTVIGAGLIVGMMMAVYLSLSALAGEQAGPAVDELPSFSDADLGALENLLD